MWSPERQLSPLAMPFFTATARQTNSPVVGLVLRYGTRAASRTLCLLIVKVSREPVTTCKDVDMARRLAEAVRRDDGVDSLASQCAARQNEERFSN